MKKAVIITAVICIVLSGLAIALPYIIIARDMTPTVGQTLSGVVSARPDMEIDTEKAETEPPPEPITITLSFIGDCMLATDRGMEYDGSFNKLAKEVEPSYFFENFVEIFEDDDWTVANLENVFTDNPDAKIRGKGYSPAYWYKSTAANTAILQSGSIEIVSLANNHSEDYGKIGYADTRAALEAADILWGDDENVLILEKEGFKIALYLCTFYYTGYDKIIADKMAEIEANYKIVYFHGGTERIHTPDSWKAAGAHRLIDSGIDLVIGGHPHVLQPIESYKGKTIVHSLGNFVFGGSRSEENRTIVYRHTLTVLEGELVDISEEVIPCYVYTDLYKPGIITDEGEIAAVMAFLNGESESPMK